MELAVFVILEVAFFPHGEAWRPYFVAKTESGRLVVKASRKRQREMGLAYIQLRAVEDRHKVWSQQLTIEANAAILAVNKNQRHLLIFADVKKHEIFIDIQAYQRVQRGLIGPVADCNPKFEVVGSVAVSRPDHLPSFGSPAVKGEFEVKIGRSGPTHRLADLVVLHVSALEV